MSSRSTFGESRRKLVLAFDVGTTYSGISYSVLDPGRIPEIKGVTRFPAHEHVSGASKIPTVIYYDRSGKVRAVGAEAMAEGIQEQAEEEQWVKVEWFKLHLRSRFGSDASKIANRIPPLPLNKTIVEVFADFLRYLFKCASKYIRETHPNGNDLWASVAKKSHFVLSHPNGWEGTEQTQMRKAAIIAGLIPDTAAGNERLLFVTEGEASLHFCIQNGLPSGAVKKGEGVVIVDAGGGTIDVSSYSKNASIFEEIAVPQCHFHGSVFVTNNAKVFLKEYLNDSPFLDDIEHIVRCFDKTTKLRFRDPKEPQYIKFGSTRDNDPSYNIRSGQLKLLGSDIALFFEPSITCIVNAVKSQRKAAHKAIKHVVLVGGFAASEYLFKKVESALAPSGLTVVRPENTVNKAVSDGALSFFLDRFVRSRVSRVTYGTTMNHRYFPNNDDHRKRFSATYVDPNTGERAIRGAFDVILPKNTQISETKEFRRTYHKTCNAQSLSKIVSVTIWCYRGLIEKPKWCDEDSKDFTKLCQLDVNLSQIPMTSDTKHNGEHEVLYAIFDIVLIFGLTEFKAQVAWRDLNNKEKRSEALIMYFDPEA